MYNSVRGNHINTRLNLEYYLARREDDMIGPVSSRTSTPLSLLYKAINVQYIAVSQAVIAGDKAIGSRAEIDGGDAVQLCVTGRKRLQQINRTRTCC